MTPESYLSRLRLSHFRNYAGASLDLPAGHVVLTGSNGAGKTNLLEAISMLAPGRGLRRATHETLVEAGSGQPWAVAATVESPDGPADLGTGLDDDGTARRARINGANARAIEDLSAYLRILWLTPDMDGLFRGPAGDRRRFFDRLVMTLIPGHGTAAASYEKAMRQRNRLLDEHGDPAWIAAIEAQMAAHGAAMHFARTDCLGHLQALARKSVAETAFPAALIALADPEPIGAGAASSTALETALADFWAATRERDRAAGRTLAGPHRIDLEITHADKVMPAALCSTGEQKALLVGLILAHARLVASVTGMAPLLLLDEIAAHFDPDRRLALFDALDRLGSQCFLTGTDRMLFEGMEASFVSVANGILTLEPLT